MDQMAQNTPWWEVTAGILAIPTVILGIILTFFIIRKTVLESRKLKLEIAEKKSATTRSASAQSPVASKGFRLSIGSKILIIIYLALNLGYLFFNGVQTAPISGIAVVALILGAFNCLFLIGAYAVLLIQGQIGEVLGVLKDLSSVLGDFDSSSEDKDR